MAHTSEEGPGHASFFSHTARDQAGHFLTDRHEGHHTALPRGWAGQDRWGQIDAGIQARREAQAEAAKVQQASFAAPPQKGLSPLRYGHNSEPVDPRPPMNPPMNHPMPSPGMAPHGVFAKPYIVL